MHELKHQRKKHNIGSFNGAPLQAIKFVGIWNEELIKLPISRMHVNVLHYLLFLQCMSHHSAWKNFPAGWVAEHDQDTCDDWL